MYTPRDVCEPMVRLALAPVLERTRDVRSIRVCDPAIGEGAFLVEIVRVLAEALGGPDARRVVAEHCIFGVDVDARAVGTARRAVESFVGASIPALRTHLHVGDALSIDWPQRFDAVIGNPPYVRQELLSNKGALRDFACAGGVVDLYGYFIELAQRIADRFCLIVPNKWMTAAYGRRLRELLARNRAVEGVVDFAAGLQLFAGVDAFPCIVWGGAGSTAPIRAQRITTPVSVADALSRAGISHPRERWTAEPWHIDSDDDGRLLESLRTRGPTLGEIVGRRWSRGVVTGCNRAFVIDRAARDALVADEPAAAALVRPFIKGRDVRNWTPGPIDRYVLLIDHGTSLAKLPRVRAHLEAFREALEPKPHGHRGEWSGRKPGSYRWYELQDPVVPLAKARTPRLFYQDIQTQPACCIDPSGELVPDTTVWILPSADLYLMTILTSPLYFWYAKRRFPPALNGAVRPKLEYMRALPIADAPTALRRKITSLAAKQCTSHRTDRDLELADLVCEAYGLTAGERALVGS